MKSKQKRLKKARHLKQQTDYHNQSLLKKIDGIDMDRLNEQDKAYLIQAREVQAVKTQSPFKMGNI